MSKIYLATLLFFIGCLGQSIKPMIDERGHFYNANATKKDTIAYFDKDTIASFDFEYYNTDVFDSAAFYFHKFIYFNRLMDKAHGRAFARFEDSCVRYKKLLDRLKK